MRIKELDGLRGIAILAVLNCHYLAWFPALGSQYGFLGVDLFFVLSGFLITGILLELVDKEHYFSIFYARRAFRIFPPYFLALAAYLVFSFVSRKPGSWSLWLQYVFYYSSLFLGPPPEFRATPPLVPMAVRMGLGVMWSLSVEEIYYTVWAPVVRFTTQRGFTLILLGMTIAAPMLRWWLHTPFDPEGYTFYCRMDALAYGSVVALCIRDRRLNPAKWSRFDKFFDWAALVVVPLAAGFWLATRADVRLRIVSVAGLVLADLSFALIVHALIRRSGGNQFWVRALRAKWLRSIGMVSYSLYLVHDPLLEVSTTFMKQFHLSRRASTLSSTSLGLMLSFGLAYALWYGLESRILRWKDRKVPNPTHARKSLTLVP